MMKNNARLFKTVLRYAALFCFFLTPFPIFSIVVQDNVLSVSYFFYAILLLEIVGFFGFALRNLLEHFKKLPAFLITILLILFAIALVSGAFYLFFGALSLNLVYVVILDAALLVLYIFTLKMFDRAYDNILTRGWFLFSAGLNVLILLVAHFTVANFTIEPMLIVFLFCVAVFAVILNQRAIDVVMDRRGHSASQLPPRIRYYNMILVAVVLAIAILLIVFRTPVVNGAKAAFSAIGGVLLRFLRWFGGLFVREQQAGEEEISAPEMEEDIAEIGEPGDPMVSRIAFIILVSLIVLFSIRPVYRKIRVLVSKLVLLLKQWIHRERVFAKHRTDENEYYTDTEETIDHDGRILDDLSPAKALRNWKKELKSFLKMPDSKEKLIYGYKLASRGLELHGCKIDPGNTQLDVLSKARSSLKGDAFEAATWCYNALVFGGYEDDLKFPQMEESLTQIRALPAVKK